MQALRRRLSEQVQSLRNHHQIAVYDTLRKHWDHRKNGNDLPRVQLPDDRLEVLLVDTPPSQLSMEDITDLADSLSLQAPSKELSTLAMERILNDGFPLQAQPFFLEEALTGNAREAIKRCAVWLGYAVAPIAAVGHQFPLALRHVTRFARLLASKGYTNIQGAGHGGDDGRLKLLILGPVLAGICEHYPRSWADASSQRRAEAEVNKLCRFMAKQEPLTECVSIRLAALVCVSGAGEGVRFLAQAEDVSRERLEIELADTFAMFKANPGLLGQAGGRKTKARVKQPRALAIAHS